MTKPIEDIVIIAKPVYVSLTLHRENDLECTIEGWLIINDLNDTLAIQPTHEFDQESVFLVIDKQEIVSIYPANPPKNTETLYLYGVPVEEIELPKDGEATGV